MPLLSPHMLILHWASLLPLFWIWLEILVGLTSFLEHLVNVCLLGVVLSLLQKSGMQCITSCGVTWLAFIKLQSCTVHISSFSPRNLVYDNFFIWRFVLKSFAFRVWVYNSSKSSSAMAHCTSIPLPASVHCSAFTWLTSHAEFEGSSFSNIDAISRTVFVVNIKYSKVFFIQTTLSCYYPPS
jgi:hypothetical protein